VYVDYNEQDKKVTYEIRGLFESTVNTLPLTDDQLIDMFKLDPEFQDISEELKSIRLNILSIRVGNICSNKCPSLYSGFNYQSCI